VQQLTCSLAIAITPNSLLSVCDVIISSSSEPRPDEQQGAEVPDAGVSADTRSNTSALEQENAVDEENTSFSNSRYIIMLMLQNIRTKLFKLARPLPTFFKNCNSCIVSSYVLIYCK